jgi:hypothetical protein
MPKEKLGHQLHEFRKVGATYLELLDNKLCILGLEEAVTTRNYYALTFDNFPDSYMLLISVSSTPISFS